jgi:hypothetical protein
MNDEGAAVVLSPLRDRQGHYYCGRNLGRSAIPGSDGQCGPTNGPQCSACKRWQTNDEGAPLFAGADREGRHYCGRILGATAIPGSDGRWGAEELLHCDLYALMF